MKPWCSPEAEETRAVKKTKQYGRKKQHISIATDFYIRSYLKISIHLNSKVANIEKQNWENRYRRNKTEIELAKNCVTMCYVCLSYRHRSSVAMQHVDSALRLREMDGFLTALEASVKREENPRF